MFKGVKDLPYAMHINEIIKRCLKVQCLEYL